LPRERQPPKPHRVAWSSFRQVMGLRLRAMMAATVARCLSMGVRPAGSSQLMISAVTSRSLVAVPPRLQVDPFFSKAATVPRLVREMYASGRRTAATLATAVCLAVSLLRRARRRWETVDTSTSALVVQPMAPGGISRFKLARAILGMEEISTCMLVRQLTRPKQVVASLLKQDTALIRIQVRMAGVVER